MVKCPKCGMEYSLGTRIYHSCEDNSICHGIVFGDDRVCRPWNCNPTEDTHEIKINADTPYPSEELVFMIKK